jgi:hypothetical protein
LSLEVRLALVEQSKSIWESASVHRRPVSLVSGRPSSLGLRLVLVEQLESIWESASVHRRLASPVSGRPFSPILHLVPFEPSESTEDSVSLRHPVLPISGHLLFSAPVLLFLLEQSAPT